jgi:poly(A) polymerase
MASRFGLAIEEETRAAAIQFAPEIRIVSAERIADELRKMFVNPNRAIAIRLLQELELIEPILPEIATVSTQSGGQGDQEWSHRVRVIEGFAACPASVISFPLVLAALLQTLGVRKAELIADRLRLSTAEKSRIAWLIQEKESLCAASGLKPSRLYPLLIQPGIHELIALHRANARAEGRGENEFDYCERVLSEKPPETLDPEPIITGNDLIELGLKPGKVFKQLLDAAREAQLDGVLSSKPQAVDFVRRLLEPKGDPGIPPDGSGSPLRG